MSVNTFVIAQIKAQVGAIQKKYPQERIIAVQTDEGWKDNSEIIIEGRTYKVCRCNSSLQIRESLIDFNSSEESLLILTGFDTKDLDHDITARLARRKIFPLDPWEILRELFQAREVSPRLLRQKWIAQFLLGDIPADGYPATPSGVLDEETVWKIILIDKMGMRSARPDVNDLMIWSLDTGKLEGFKVYSEEIQRSIQEWIKNSAGELARLIFAAVKEGAGNMLVSLGLACEIIFAGQDEPQLKQSSVRLERYFANQPLPEIVLAEFASAALNTVNYLRQAKPAAVHKIFAQTEEILNDIHISDFAYLSTVLPLGFEGRLTNYGKELIKLTQDKTLKISDSFRAAFDKALIHQLALQNKNRRTKIEMSFRLINWLISKPPTEFESFDSAAKTYASEISYADWARNVILHGDANATFAAGLTGLQKLVTGKREEQNKSFGHLIVSWTESGSTGEEVWRVEDVLEQTAAKIGAQTGVLLIVMDGMSYAAFHEIKQGIQTNGWQSLAPKDGNIKPVIAALPSVTGISRTSLLCGKLLRGNSSTEVREFSKNQSLASISKTGYPPKVFHKSSIADGVGAALTKELTDALFSEDQRIVGVVVNSIDDHLAKGEQIAVTWNLETLPLLNKLLIAAAESDRAVILTSDHGHVIEQDGSFQKEDSAGERYRESDGQPKKGELAISGSRVLGQTGHKIIAPWSETIRYAKKKHGYHGGISPQECVIPIAILSQSQDTLKNWQMVNESICMWWDVEPTDSSSITNFEPPENKKQSGQQYELLPLFS